MTISKTEKPIPNIVKRRDTSGVKSNLSRPEFLIKIFKSNFKKKLIDIDLIHLLHEEFPQLKDVTEPNLRVFRSYFNRGKLNTQEDIPPKRTLFAYDAGGNKLPPLKRGRKKIESDKPLPILLKPKKKSIKLKKVKKK